MTMTMMTLSSRIVPAIVIGFVILLTTTVSAFSLAQSSSSLSSSSRFLGQRMKLIQKTTSPSRQKQLTVTTMFLGSDGGLLGVGAPEVATILLVGYFILGPSDLYKLTKEIGKFIQNFRTLGAEATKTLETSMESQLQLDDIRKAQRELNDAFSFRRTINVDDDGDAFSTIPSETRPGAEPIVSSTTASGGKKKLKKIRRRKVIVNEEINNDIDIDINEINIENQIPPNRVDMEQALMSGELGMDVPDLDLSEMWSPEEVLDKDAALLRQNRMERLKGGGYNMELPSPAQQDRFSQQLSGDWNARILANEDKLQPLALVMERLAILEEEKEAADARLEEEFRLRAELEEKYYKNKRQILEDAAATVQADAYVSLKESDP